MPENRSCDGLGRLLDEPKPDEVVKSIIIVMDCQNEGSYFCKSKCEENCNLYNIPKKIKQVKCGINPNDSPELIKWADERALSRVEIDEEKLKEKLYNLLDNTKSGFLTANGADVKALSEYIKEANPIKIKEAK